jgi:hypothetical protein
MHGVDPAVLWVQPSGVARVTKLVGQNLIFFQFSAKLVKNNIKIGIFIIFCWGICPKCPAVATPLVQPH